MADLVDKGKSNSEIVDFILQADEKGIIKIPFKIWAICDRVKIARTQMSFMWHADGERIFNNNPQSMFFDEPKWVRQFRHVLQTEDRSFVTFKKRPAWQSKILTQIPQLDDWFGSGKRTILQDLNILDQHHQWSEVGFQHMIYVYRKALRKKCEPNGEIFRLWVNGLADMEGNLKGKVFSFDWLLCNDLLAPEQKHNARKISELILSIQAQKPIKIDQTITAAQVKIIDQVLAWFLPDPLIRDRNRYLLKLTLLISGNPDINWNRMEKSIKFGCHHLKKTPDFELLKDYLNGEVDFEGRGKFQR